MTHINHIGPHALVCCAQKAALVETQITEIMVTPHGSNTTGKTDLVYTLRLSPKRIADTEARTFSAVSPSQSHMLSPVVSLAA